MATQAKKETVEKIKESLSQAQSLVLTDHTGLTHKQMESLRKAVKQVGGNFYVAKNTLLKKALEGSVFEGKVKENFLQGPTSILLSVNDEITALQKLIKAIKEFNLPKIKQGALKDRFLTDNEVITLANLPSKKVLISQLIGMLQSPQTRLVFALKGNLTKLTLILKALLGKKQIND